jgi:lipopolysaccharide assembly outer membrane protein LptD (OstA)
LFAKQLNFVKLKARILKNYYEKNTKGGEKRFRYSLDEDASTTLKNALKHQNDENQRKLAFGPDDNEERWAEAVSPPGVIETNDNS